MRKLVLSAAVLAVVAAAPVRVQLVAVAQEPSPNKAEASATAADATPKPAEKPAGPPTKVNRELLTYDGKRFEDYEVILASELAPDRRAEAIVALNAFAPVGYANEVADIVVAELKGFDERRVADKRTEALQLACVAALREIDSQVVIPKLVALIRDGGYGPRQLALLSIRRQHNSDEILKAVVKVVSDVDMPAAQRETALIALHYLDPNFQQNMQSVREAVLGKGATPKMREIVEGNLARADMLSPEAFDAYVRDLAAPTLIEMIRRQEIAADDGMNTQRPNSAFRQHPEYFWPFIIESSVSLRDMSKQGFIRTLSWEPTWSIPKLLQLAENSEAIEKERLLQLIRRVLAVSNGGGTRQARNERTELMKDYVAFLAKCTDAEPKSLSDAAAENLSMIYGDHRFGVVRFEIEKELNRRRIAITDEWMAKYTSLRNMEEEDLR